jgi:hypothetical protein
MTWTITEISNRNIPRGKRRSARKADNITVVSKPIILEKENTDQQYKVGPESIPKLPPIYIAGVKNISQLIQLSEQIANHQYEIKALTDNQVKVQPKTSEFYRTIIRALAKKHL